MATRRLTHPEVRPKRIEMLAIYTVRDGKIARVDFVK
jgi:hypothetical protein